MVHPIKVTHEQFQNMVVEVAQLTGWKVQYWWKSYHSPAGFPDLLLVKPPKLVAFELKIEPDKPTKAQQDWIDILNQVPSVRAFVVYHKDFDFITEVLNG